MSTGIDDLRTHGIIFTPRGLILKNPRMSPGNAGKKNIRKRGKILTFSKASRRRLRKIMMERYPVKAFGKMLIYTFTLPYDMTVYEETALWKRYQSDFLSKTSVAMIWRREITRRGRSHWHVICAMPVWYRPVRIVERWIKLLENTFGSLPPGIAEHAVKMEWVDDHGGAWLRYMIDHTSKRKFYQCLPAGCGRHWGVVGKKYLVEMRFSEILVSHKMYYRVVRVIRRMLAYRRGGKIFRRKNRACIGTSCWFMEDRKIHAVSRWMRYLSGEDFLS
jgi:hypothetical protein